MSPAAAGDEEGLVVNRTSRRRRQATPRYVARRDLIPWLDILEARSLLASVFWDGGGGNSDWNNALNWSGDHVPTSSEIAVIDLVGTFTVNLTSDVTLAGLAIGGPSGSQTLNATGRKLSLA